MGKWFFHCLKDGANEIGIIVKILCVATGQEDPRSFNVIMYYYYIYLSVYKIQ